MMIIVGMKRVLLYFWHGTKSSTAVDFVRDTCKSVEMGLGHKK